MAGSEIEAVGKGGIPRVRSRDGGRPGVRAALAEVESGQAVPADEVEAWVDSWDTPNELSMPRPRRPRR